MRPRRPGAGVGRDGSICGARGGGIMPVPVSFRQRGPPALLPLFKPLGVDGAGVVGIEAIGKRVTAHAAVGKACEREKQKICADTQGKPGETIACLLKAPTRGVSAGCNKALNEAGYR